MKIYSSDSVTKEYVDEAIKQVATQGQRNVVTQVSDLDQKQNKRIAFLQRLLLLSFAVNAMLAAGAYFVKL